MSIERTIVQRLFESKDLYEAEFQAGGSTYKCAFGKYYKDGEQISREEYFKAKETGSSGGNSSAAPQTPAAPSSAASTKKTTSPTSTPTQMSSKVQDAFNNVKISKAASKAFTPLISSLKTINQEGVQSFVLYGGKYVAFPANEGSSYEDLSEEISSFPGMEIDSSSEKDTSFKYKGKYNVYVYKAGSGFSGIEGAPSVIMELN